MELCSQFDQVKNIYPVQIAGEYRRPGDAHQVQRMVAEFCAAHACRRVFIDLTRATVIGGTLPTYQTGAIEPDVGRVLRTLRFALLYAEITRDELFFEDVVRNRGFRARVFAARDDADAWLGKQQG